MSATASASPIPQQFQSVFSLQSQNQSYPQSHHQGSRSVSSVERPQFEMGSRYINGREAVPNSREASKPELNTKENIPALQVLLGPEASTWPFSEESLRQALEVRIQQERTKQEFYKAESINRSLELMRLASKTNVPGHLIPLLFNVSEDSVQKLNDQQELLARQKRTSQDATSDLRQPIPQMSRPSVLHRTSHERSNTVSRSDDIKKDLADSRSNPMESYRFGSGSTSPVRKTSLNPRHQLSPYKIGAQAVSSLGGRYPHISTNNLKHGVHQRTISLPPQVSIPETESLDFSGRQQDNHNMNLRHRHTSSRTSSQIVIPEELLSQETPKKRKTESVDWRATNEDVGSSTPSKTKTQPTHMRMLSTDVTTLASPVKKDNADDESVLLDDDSIVSLNSPGPTTPERGDKSRPKFPNDILS
ncbi:hypothetical protein CANARDRAFT_177091 [[Candida] arabinofermentans NRRL YB-2248]|uniref:Uncharacterized protein n=1 Tax=[Candida] arabinofermentans NRRL YB-2248 TaxID=983967 RepID=A0A1E4SXI6_9ASCO|nr:hypothetical protein CANARDRAFT_177091 [[Candida] arabinofermentans NRRL YB-2248]